MPKDKTIILTKDDLPEIPASEELVIPELDYGMGEKIGGWAIGSNDITKKNKSLNDIGDAIDTDGNVIAEIINNKLNTSAQTILADFTFGASGAIQIGEYEAGVSGDIRISPNGIIGRNSSNEITFSIDATTGDPTFAGELTAAQITTGTLSVDRIEAGSIVSSKIGSDLDDGNISSINFNNITASNIDADTITAGTLTGRTVRTASSGQRVTLDGSNNKITFHDSGGTDRGSIWGTSSGIYISGEINSSSEAEFYRIRLGAGAGAGIEVDWNNSIDLGTDNYKFRSLYLGGGLLLGNSAINIDGGMYYNSSTEKLRVRIGGLWYTVDVTYEP